MPETYSQRAEKLVKFRIRGPRKGAKNEPASAHSLRVGELIQKHGYGEEVIIAAILHDIVEDGGMTFVQLVAKGYTPRVIQIVKLCTHNKRVRNRDARWQLLVAGLVTARDREAWAVKIADVLDNFRSSKTLPRDRAAFFRGVKAPLVLNVSEDLMGKTAIWKELKREIEHSMSRALYHFVRKFFSLKALDGVVGALKTPFI